MILQLLILFFVSSIADAASLPEVLAPSSQLIVVIANNDHSSKAEIRRIERDGKGWHLVGIKSLAVLGKNGIATGNGIYAGPEFMVEKPKSEGDGRSPTGIFEVGKVFGIAKAKDFQGLMPYETISASLEGVDDPESSYYNRIVDRSALSEPSNWKSHEAILRKDRLYQWLLEIRHNPENIPGHGSLIFLHVWRRPSAGTAGCVAMEESKLLNLLRWLDPTKHPRLVVIPARNLQQFGKALGVPTPW